MLLASALNPLNAPSQAMARSSYLQDSIGHLYANRLLQRLRRPRSRLHSRRNQPVRSLRLRLETTLEQLRWSQHPWIVFRRRERFVPTQNPTPRPTRPQLATTVPPSRFANDSSLV